MEHLTMESFREKICDCGLDGSWRAEWKYKGDIPSVIDFYADWCGPCRMVSPILEQLAEEYKGRINIYKVNTESEPQLAAAFGVTSIPSLLFVPVEGRPQMSTGALPQNEFKRLFRDVLGEN
jgi:thioredoxin